MKKEYSAPLVEIRRFETQDVLLGASQNFNENGSAISGQGDGGAFTPFGG